MKHFLAAAILVASLVSAEQAHGFLLLNSLANQTQNFDFLASSGSKIAWVNNQQPTQTSTGSPGWYWQGTPQNSNDAPYSTDNGNTDHGTAFSYGVAGVNPVTDRAMGNIGDSGNQNTAMGIVFKNNSGQTIQSITVTYTGEEWRRNSSSNEVLTFSYKSSSADITDMVPAMGALPGTWNGFTALNFVPPVSGGGGQLDGNAPANRTTKNAVAINVSVPNGEFLALRWHDGDSTGSDMGMGIDDLTVTFSTVAVPEPGALAFGGTVCVILGIVALKRRIPFCSKSKTS